MPISEGASNLSGFKIQKGSWSHAGLMILKSNQLELLWRFAPAALQAVTGSKTNYLLEPTISFVEGC